MALDVKDIERAGEHLWNILFSIFIQCQKDNPGYADLIADAYCFLESRYEIPEDIVFEEAYGMAQERAEQRYDEANGK